MIEDRARTAAAALAVRGGNWRQLSDYEIEVLLKAGYIEPVDPPAVSAPGEHPKGGYQVTRAGEEFLTVGPKK